VGVKVGIFVGVEVGVATVWSVCGRGNLLDQSIGIDETNKL